MSFFTQNKVLFISFFLLVFKSFGQYNAHVYTVNDSTTCSINEFPGGVRGIGSFLKPFKSVEEVPRGLIPGIYWFDFWGTISSTYIDENGWIMVASSEYNYIGDLDTLSSLQLQGNNIFTPSILGNLGNITEVRINNTRPGASVDPFDIQTNDAGIISRLKNNIQLTYSPATTATWTGTDTLTNGLYCCQATCAPASFPLYSRIFHACGEDALHWLTNFSGTSFNRITFSDTNEADFNLWVRGNPDDIHPDLWFKADQNKVYTCPSQLKGKASGEYFLDPDNDGNDILKVYYDASEGGGWLMALNYVHLGGTNPNLTVMTNKLPLLGSSTLGINEQDSTELWGHASNSLLSQFNISEVRFYGATALHSRIMHFSTDNSNVINYIKTGTGNMLGIATGYDSLSNHSAFLPRETANYFNNQGDLALTNFPFWLSGTYHWGIKGLGNRWEVDDFPKDSSQNTIHRVWIRTNDSCLCNKGAVNIYNDGDTVSLWNDISQYNRNAKQSNISKQPIFKNNTTDNINFNPVIDFDGINDELTGVYETPVSAPGTIYFVVKEENTSSSQIAAVICGNNGIGGGSFGLGIYYNFSSDRFTIDGNGAGSGNSSNTVSTPVRNRSRLVTGIYNTSNSTNNSEIYMDGALEENHIGASVGNSTALVNFRIGSRISPNGSLPGRIFGGKIAEIIEFTNVNSQTDRLKIETYLAIKYGITLNHNYLSSDSLTLYDISNGYGNGIFGLGKDIKSGLHQTSSKSESDITSGLTFIATTNFSTDNFLLTGHNGGALTRRNFVGETNVLTREWFADMNGNIGTVNIDLDLATIGANTSPLASDVKIIIANNSTFTNAHIIEATSVVGGIAKFEGIPLYDKYYTFSAAP